MKKTFELVDGKIKGKSFDFKLDPKKMAIYKTEATLRKKIDEYVAKSGVFKKEDLKDLKYNMKDFLAEWKKQIPILEAEKIKELEASTNNTENRITPELITRLANNEVFVFGSNAQGLHYGGAAKVAVEKFGAIMGQGHGLQGKSYAINTMSGIEEMAKDIKNFCEFAKANPQKLFLVTPIGCGIAGYRPEEVAPLFKECKDLENVSLPSSFWKVLGIPPSKGKDYYLDRFIDAQAHSYEIALNEDPNSKITLEKITRIDGTTDDTYKITFVSGTFDDQGRRTIDSLDEEQKVRLLRSAIEVLPVGSKIRLSSFTSTQVFGHHDINNYLLLDNLGMVRDNNS